jgi:hypothetical protein
VRVPEVNATVTLGPRRIAHMKFPQALWNDLHRLLAAANPNRQSEVLVLIPARQAPL